MIVYIGWLIFIFYYLYLIYIIYLLLYIFIYYIIIYIYLLLYYIYCYMSQKWDYFYVYSPRNGTFYFWLWFLYWVYVYIGNGVVIVESTPVWCIVYWLSMCRNVPFHCDFVSVNWCFGRRLFWYFMVGDFSRWVRLYIFGMFTLA